ncbi:hypothetical protein JMA_09710 [Jeotgalibacillus malaysiensis]|uniref:Uncharacterized protein n=1 Tax=Jeotgalibacillus malaysiensis TaxID=1508404 RepID=A0A0B5AP32_9BACL|nr:hypothetical protein JMA_09710 [Jeotgalibacillus malaysiensis]
MIYKRVLCLTERFLKILGYEATKNHEITGGAHNGFFK